MQYHRKTLSILAAAALLLAGATQLSGCISIPSRESTTVDQTSPTSSTSSTSASASASGTSSATNGPLDAVTWSFPTNESGWQIDFIDQEGRNQLVKPNGCMYSTMQNLFPAKKTFPTRPKPTIRWNSASMASNDRCAPQRAKQPRQPT